MEEAAQVKTCSRCGVEKAISGFHRHKGPSHEHGVATICKECRKSDQQRRRANLLEGTQEGRGPKQCKRCRVDKPRAQFYSNPDNKDGLFGICKVCHGEQRRERAERNRGRELPTTKACKECGVEKAGTEFYAHAGFSDGIEALCKQCKRSHQAKSRRKYLYGLTDEAYQGLLIDQDFQCVICGAPSGQVRLDVDHCHMTGAVRGLLCSTCNIALGYLDYLRGDPDRLTRTISYLRRSRGYTGQLLQPPALPSAQD